MIGRVGRLVRGEALKLSSHPFLLVTLILMAVGTVLGEELLTLLKGQKETAWRSLHAVQLFSYGFQVGLKLATFALVIFSSMLVAGEFDKGTIKVILTRPVTRTDVFLAKAATVFGLAVLLFAFVLFVALAWALAQGTLGPVWDDTTYLVQREASEIEGHAIRAVGVSALSFLAVGFLGLLVSTWTESSGYAVAIGLMLFLFGDIVTGMLSERTQLGLFLHYGPYAVGKLQEFASGGTTRWSPEIVDRSLHVTVPLTYIAAFLPAAYGLFRAKNITA